MKRIQERETDKRNQRLWIAAFLAIAFWATAAAGVLFSEDAGAQEIGTGQENISPASSEPTQPPEENDTGAESEPKAATPPEPPAVERIDARQYTPIDLVCAMGRVYIASSGSPIAPVWDAGGLPLKCADVPADMRYLRDRGISTEASIIAEMPTRAGRTYAACVMGRVYFTPSRRMTSMAPAWDLQGRPLRCSDWDGLIEHADRFPTSLNQPLR